LEVQKGAGAGDRIEARPGKIVAQVDPSNSDAAIQYRILAEPLQSKPDQPYEYRLLAQPVQAKPDPRIEDLVKQAEAIAPARAPPCARPCKPCRSRRRPRR